MRDRVGRVLGAARLLRVRRAAGRAGEGKCGKGTLIAGEDGGIGDGGVVKEVETSMRGLAKE